jgi:hypothetical protein
MWMPKGILCAKPGLTLRRMDVASSTLQALMEVVDETIRVYDPDLRIERRIQ